MPQSTFVLWKKPFQKNLIPEEYRFSSIIPVVAYSEDDGIFWCESKDKKYVAFGFICTPICGADDKVEDQVNALLNEYYPTDSMMQVVSFRSPDIVKDVHRMKSMRRNIRDPILRKIIDQRGDFLRTHAKKRIIVNCTKDNSTTQHDMGYVFNLQTYITLKIPLKGNSISEEELSEILSIKTKVKTTLENIRLSPTPMTADSWLRLMGTMINWNDAASWAVDAADWDKKIPLSQQVLDMDNDIEISAKSIRLGNKYLKILSPKRRPEFMHFGEAIYGVGDLMGRMTGVSQNYFIAATIYFPDVESTKAALDRKRQFSINQSQGPMVKFLPQLISVKNDFDALYESTENKGRKPLKISYHVGVYANSENEADAAAVSVKNFWRGMRFELMEDKSVMFPLLVNCLPLCQDVDSVQDLQRHKTATCKEAAPFLPIFGEWRGTGTPHINLFSRNGQLMTFSLHDTGSNKNGIIAATSGAGKSFLTNEIIASYLSEGAQVWVIDVGYSYKKLCNTLKGDFVQFGGGNKACLNPFPLVISLDGTRETCAPEVPADFQIDDEDAEEDALVGLLAAMAAPTQPLSDFQIASLKKILRDVWMTKFRSTTVTDIANACLNHEDLRVRDIGTQLYAFTEDGSYARYFQGKNTVNFTNIFTVLELEELKGKKHLQQVVLLQLIYQIQQEIYLGERDKKKIVIIDEAWDLLNQGDVAKFIEAGYRRFRKYGGSIVIVTQSMNDLYTSSTGKAICENTATTIMLQQKADTIQGLKDQKKLNFPDSVFDMMKTVHTNQGVYSEMFIASDYGYGIGRLIVNDFQKLLYSTDASEVYLIEQYQNTGLSLEQAIENIISDRAGN